MDYKKNRHCIKRDGVIGGVPCLAYFFFWIQLSKVVVQVKAGISVEGLQGLQGLGEPPVEAWVEE